ncbi:MAG: glycoside hydrolase family 5 protein [Solirubrobacteraceae bacterium]
MRLISTTALVRVLLSKLAVRARVTVGARVALGALVALGAVAALPAPALASHRQLAIIEDGSDLINAPAALAQFRALGANTVRVVLWWYLIAPDPNSAQKPSFDATDPGAYPAAGWAQYDAIVRQAQADGLKVYIQLSGGAPRWAEASNPPKHPTTPTAALAWKPNAADYGQFVQAVATRYSGSYTPPGAASPLPAVHLWSLFNEPNFGEDLGPQAINGSRVATAPAMYRNLVQTSWKALHGQAAHSHDTILIGELAAQGQEPSRPTRKAPQGYPGNFGQTRPQLFIRDLYCVGKNLRPLRGAAARAVQCPAGGAAARNFRRDNPGLFSASGFALHPYPQGQSPVSRAGNLVDYALFPDIPAVERLLDRVNGAYGSHTHFPIYNTEYGYITSPPKGHPYVSPQTAAYYINWAEYLSWRSPRIASYMQYLLTDPQVNPSNPLNNFASGLEFANGRPKADFYAYRLPLYMPQTSLTRGRAVEVWGDARPAPFMVADGAGPQTIEVQLNGQTVKTVTIGGSQPWSGYFDLHLRFARSGNVRLAYTYPQSDPLLPVSDLGQTVYSRTIRIRVS